MQQLLDRLEEQVCICKDTGEIIFCNQAMLEMLGYEQYELMGKNITEWINLNIDNKKLDGQKIICECINRAGHRALGGVEVIDEQWKDQKVKVLIGKWRGQKLKMIESFLKEVKVEIAIKDPQGKYVYINESCARRMRRTPDDMLGKTDEAFFEPEIVACYLKEDIGVRETGKPIILQQEMNIYGSKRVYEITKIPFDLEGESYIGLVMRDITLMSCVQDKCMEEIDVFEEIYQHGNKKNLKSGLKCVEGIITNYIDTQSFNIWVYNKEESSIIPCFRSEVVEKYLDGKKGSPITEKHIQNFKDGNFQKVRATNSFPLNGESEEVDYTKPVQYIVLNPLIYRNEFLGIMSMVYDDYPNSKVTKNYVIDNLVSQISFILKKEQIYTRLNEEWRKRIAAEKELQIFLSIASDFTTKISRSGEIMEINSLKETILGWDKATFRQLLWKEILHPEDYEKYKRRTAECYINSNVGPIVVRMKKKSGQYAWISCYGVYVEENDYVVYTAKDITQQKELEAKEDSANKVLRMEQMRSEFFANISHELKTPITIILASIQVLRKAIDDQGITIDKDFEGQKYIKMLQQNSYRLLRLVNNLIDVTKIDAGFYKLNRKNANIINIVEEISMSVVEYARQKDIELIFDTEVEEEVLACDPDKIERIILNLLSNAIKHTPTGGCITVQIDVVHDQVVIHVTDTGKGIPQDQLESIFERFVQIEDAKASVDIGSGIGLSLVKSLVELHGGSISVCSECGKGSEFVIKLPREQIDGEEVLLEDLVSGQERLEKCNIEFSDIYNISKVK